jgi:hypothetical protein
MRHSPESGSVTQDAVVTGDVESHVSFKHPETKGGFQPLCRECANELETKNGLPPSYPRVFHQPQTKLHLQSQRDSLSLNVTLLRSSPDLRWSDLGKGG